MLTTDGMAPGATSDLQLFSTQLECSINGGTRILMVALEAVEVIELVVDFKCARCRHDFSTAQAIAYLVLYISTSDPVL